MNVCLQQLIEAQVDRTPDRVAVVFEDQRLTYRELDHRANQLAHRLRGLGVGPDVRVGLFVERRQEACTVEYANDLEHSRLAASANDDAIAVEQALANFFGQKFHTISSSFRSFCGFLFSYFFFSRFFFSRFFFS